MNTPALYNHTFNSQHHVRTVVIDEQPWFVAKDVCAVLGLTNSRKALTALDEDEKQSAVIPTSKKGVTDGYTPSNHQRVQVVNESGVYALVFKSRKPEARTFRKWVTNEVLPAIRRTGGYQQPGATAPKQPRTGKAAPAGVLDARATPCTMVAFAGGQVRMVDIDGKQWYNLPDAMRCLGSRSSAYCAARRLPAEHKAQILLFNAKLPGWHTTELGMRLIAGSRRMLTSQLSFQLD